MKKIVVLLAMAVAVMGSFGQNITRMGDTYYVDNQVMKKNSRYRMSGCRL